MMNISSKQIGDKGENLACEFLTKNMGMTILDRNWKTRHCEIDIVAEKLGIIYFIEVKYRRSNKYGDGLEAINARKLNQMVYAAETWVTVNNWLGDYQLLVAAVNPDGVELVEI